MRIRLKKGVALIGTIAGAAIATALIVVNVNQGNSVNVSEMEGSGLLDGIEGAFQNQGSGEAQKPTVVADAQGTDAAAAAGVLGDVLAEEDRTDAPAQGDAGRGTADAAGTDDTGSGETASAHESAGYTEAAGSVQQPTSAPAASEVQTYVEAVPQTRTETVVSEKAVTVETPVTVTEQVTEEVEIQSVDFIERSGEAAAQEMTTNRRAQEAQAAYEADQARLKAAALSATTSDYAEVTGDDVTDSEFIVFY